MIDRPFFRIAGPIALSLCAAFPAHSQDDSAVEGLVDLGKKLLKEQKIAEACSKFTEANRLRSSARTLILLGKCHIEQGKFASAWAEYKQVERLTKGVSEEEARWKEATAKIEELSPKLSYLIIDVSQKVPGLEVRRDTTLLTEAAFATELPVDPGHYLVSANAPGFKPWSSGVDVGPAPAKKTLKIPPLEPLAASPPASAPPASSASAPPATSAPPAASMPEIPAGSQPTVGWVLTGAGVVATGVGLYFGLRANNSYKDAKTGCPTLKQCSPDSLSLRDQANHQATISNFTVGGGLLAAGVGVFLILSSKTASPASAFAPVLAPGHLGASFAGSF